MRVADSPRRMAVAKRHVIAQSLTVAWAVLGFISLAGLPGGSAQAEEVEPNEFVPLPAGTNLAIGYYLYGHDTQYNFAKGPTFKDKTGLEVNIAVARYVHCTEVFDHPAGFEVFQAFGALSSGQIGGQKLNNAFGAQNLAMAAFFWPYANKQAGQYVVTAAWLYPPTGTYDPHSILNVGDNRWRGALQVGWDQAIGSHFSYDIGTDVEFFGDNTNAFPGGQRLTQTPSYRLQAFANWRWTRKWQTSVGYEGLFGGIQRVDGLRNGTRTEEQRLRLVASYFVTPALQVLLEPNHDLSAVGGFKQDFGATLRVVYAF
jgi:hypothetical protein